MDHHIKYLLPCMYEAMGSSTHGGGTEARKVRNKGKRGEIGGGGVGWVGSWLPGRHRFVREAEVVASRESRLPLPSSGHANAERDD